MPSRPSKLPSNLESRILSIDIYLEWALPIHGRYHRQSSPSAISCMLFIINVLSSSRAIQDLKSILRYLSKVCGHSISPVVFVVADPRAAVHNLVHLSITEVGASKTNVSLTFYYLIIISLFSIFTSPRPSPSPKSMPKPNPIKTERGIWTLGCH